MPDQVFIGKFSKGLKEYYKSFYNDNDSWSTLFNTYVWRGQVQRKRGTSLLGQLQKQVISVAVVANNWEKGPLVLVAGAGNLISGFSLETDSTITPGSIDFTVGVNTYTEPSPPDGTLLKNGLADPNSSINYATGAVFIQGGGAGPLTGTFSYYPGLPVMGLRDFVASPGQANFPVLLAFDTKYSYQINQTSFPPNFFNTTYYKLTDTPFVWSGQDYQQFFTNNYSDALWATNNKPGFHFVNGTYTAGSGTANITFNFKSLGVNYPNLIVGDKLWFNEWDTGGSNINGLTAEVSNAADAVNGNYIVTFDMGVTVAGTGIAQLLTASISGQDGIKWYDGDPTANTGLPVGNNLGWVNFAPPLTAATVSINNIPLGKYYLVGALAIVPFKDRLLFFSPYVRTSTGNNIQMIDTVIWSWNGTPYYAAVTPTLMTSDTTAYYVDQTGKGGYISAGIEQPIATVGNNEDVLLVGFGGEGRKTRFVYTGDDLNPFLFFNINSQLPSSATFSSVTLDKGSIDIGTYGICLTDQQSSQRIDLDIPDQVFKISQGNNGVQRVNAIRDFFREWIYFSYPYATNQWTFPTRTFLFNYRDNTWAFFYENFTTHGRYRELNLYTWETVPYPSWNDWNEPWNSGLTDTLIPDIIAGNPQGYVLILDEGTGEGVSGTILSITNSAGGFSAIKSIDHCVSIGDYLYFKNALGVGNTTITGITLGTTTTITTVNTLLPGQQVFLSGIVGTIQLNSNVYTILSTTATTITIDVDSTNFTAYSSGGNVSAFNGLIGRVSAITDADNFEVDIRFPAGTYLGLGQFARLVVPLMITKQFNFYWEQGRKTRLGVQRYLLDGTFDSQVTLNVYLSENSDTVWNETPLVPLFSSNNALIYSQVLYTCSESTNLGLTPANTNLQMPTAVSQQQIWHRVNTSMIGDTVQIGITLSDAQMRIPKIALAEINLHAVQLTTYPSQMLS